MAPRPGEEEGSTEPGRWLIWAVAGRGVPSGDKE